MDGIELSLEGMALEAFPEDLCHTGRLATAVDQLLSEELSLPRRSKEISVLYLRCGIPIRMSNVRHLIGSR